ncbi:MAG: hypothetical protein V4547_18295 [Bacteroidota bacterium]
MNDIIRQLREKLQSNIKRAEEETGFTVVLTGGEVIKPDTEYYKGKADAFKSTLEFLDKLTKQV